MRSGISFDWNDIINQYFTNNQIDLYFFSEYVKLYESSKEEAICFYAIENDKCMLFPIIRRKFTFENSEYYDFETAYGYGGPIYNTEDLIFCQDALNNFNNYCSDNNFVAGFIRFHPLLENHKFFNIGQVIEERRIIAMNISSSEDSIWQTELHSKNRNMIKKAEKSNLRFFADYEYSYLDDFSRLYKGTMNRLSATSFYCFEDEYYTSFKNVIKNSFLGLVFLGERIISAAIFFYHERYGHYHLAGSDGEYLNYSPNNFMLWEAAKELKKRGVQLFHLGGGLDSSPDNSLYKFKRRFSSSSLPFYMGKCIFNQKIYNAICSKWILANPEKEVLYKHYLLKYKY